MPTAVQHRRMFYGARYDVSSCFPPGICASHERKIAGFGASGRKDNFGQISAYDVSDFFSGILYGLSGLLAE